MGLCSSSNGDHDDLPRTGSWASTDSQESYDQDNGQFGTATDEEEEEITNLFGMKCDPEGVLVMLRSNSTSLMRLTDAKNPRGAGHVRVFFVFLSSLKIFPFFFLLLKIRYSKKFLKVIYSMAQISLCLITYTKLSLSPTPVAVPSVSTPTSVLSLHVILRASPRLSSCIYCITTGCLSKPMWSESKRRVVCVHLHTHKR